MKKCLLMFALLVLALVIAVLLENDTRDVTNQGVLLSENHIENTAFGHDKFE